MDKIEVIKEILGQFVSDFRESDIRFAKLDAIDRVVNNPNDPDSIVLTTRNSMPFFILHYLCEVEQE